MSRVRLPIFVLAALALAAPAHGLAILADDRVVVERHRDECGGPLIHDTTEPGFLVPFDHPRQASSFSVDADGLGFAGSVRGGGSSLSSSLCDPLAEVSYEFSSDFDVTFRIDGDGAWMTASGGVDDYRPSRFGETGRPYTSWATASSRSGSSSRSRCRRASTRWQWAEALPRCSTRGQSSSSTS